MSLIARMRRRLGAQGGYTLVEMLTVLLILGVVMGGLTTVLASATNADADMNNRFQAQQATRLAMDKLRQVLELARPAGNRIGQAMALNALGEALLATGCPVEARTAHEDALRLATQIGVPGEQDRARRGLAAVAARG